MNKSEAMTNAHTIEWHENCYKNWKQSLDTQEERIIKELERIKADRERLNFYAFQIEEAKQEKKESFDKDKFRVIKVPKKDKEVKNVL